MRRGTLGAGGLTWAAILVLFLGCATGKRPDQAVDLTSSPPEPSTTAVADATPEAPAIRQFEQNREAAEFAAAGASLREGALADAQRRLEKIVARNPEHQPAQLLLAETLASRGETGEAFERLERLAQKRPDDHRARDAMARLAVAAVRETPERRAGLDE